MKAHNLPAFDSLVSAYKPSVNRPALVVITHLLPTSIAYLESLSRVFDLTLIGIPYSSPESTVERLRTGGYRLQLPKSIQDLPAAAFNAVEQIVQRRRTVIVQEVGGYLAQYAAPLSKFKGFLGVVEDTMNGHWRYEAQEGQLKYPVLSIARSPIKAIEDSLIGEAVSYSLERVLREELFTVLKGKRVLVVGFGSIGASCANALRHRGATASVFDVDPLKVMRARAEGFLVGEFSALLAQADVVIGATGQRSLGLEALKISKPGAVIASASSKQLEIDVADLRRSLSCRQTGPTTECFENDSCHFYLLSQGFPINFRDHSVLGDILDAIYSELFICIRELAERRAHSGLHHTWLAIHREVAEAWCRNHLRDSIPNARENRPIPEAVFAKNRCIAPTLQEAPATKLAEMRRRRPRGLQAKP
jgi:adenosylhomocysteinase